MEAVEAEVRVSRLGPSDWQLLRDVRLAALADAPYAFASSYDREVQLDERRWRERAETAAWFVARKGGTIAGIAAGISAAGAPADERHLVSMWVSAEARGSGAANLLLDAVTGWARDEGAAALTLWVADGNTRARRFYGRKGFHATGRRQPLPSAPETGEEEMRLNL